MKPPRKHASEIAALPFGDQRQALIRTVPSHWRELVMFHVELADERAAAVRAGLLPSLPDIQAMRQRTAAAKARRESVPRV